MAWAGYSVVHTSTPAPPIGAGWWAKKAIHRHPPPQESTQKYTNILALLWYLATLEYTRSSYVNNNKPFHP